MQKPQLKIVVGSQNPVKVSAVKSALGPYFPETTLVCTGLKAPSGVPDQPMNAAQTRNGALNRLDFCCTHASADFYVAMEGGVDLFEDGPCTFAYVVIADNQRRSVGRSAMLPIPRKVYNELQNGRELGDVMDEFFNTTNSKELGGAIGHLTQGHESRGTAYTQALRLAMAPFINPGLYDSPNK